MKQNIREALLKVSGWVPHPCALSRLRVFLPSVTLCSPSSFVILAAVSVASGVADQFVVFHILRRRPNRLPDIETGRLPLENQLVEGYPGSGIHLRIVNRHGQLQVITIRAVEALLPAQIGAMRTTCSIDPGSFIHP